jgi:glycosyltransferase involved in cell wall biosynthesis
MLTDIREQFDSLAHVYNTTEALLRQAHKVIRPPADYFEATERRKCLICEEIIENSDIVVARPDLRFLRTRERVGKHLPYLVFLLGGAPRGLPNLRRAWRYFRSSDVLIGNCAGDREIAKAFVPNAQFALLPFSFDDAKFFPLSPAYRDRIKASWGFSRKDKILLYAGRITLEKNVHTLLRISSILQGMDANIHLILAGTTSNLGFEDFGVFPSDLRRSLHAMVDRLGLDRRRLHFVGHKTAAQLLQLYNIADVFVNMTLNHDENFGLAPNTVQLRSQP